MTQLVRLKKCNEGVILLSDNVKAHIKKLLINEFGGRVCRQAIIQRKVNAQRAARAVALDTVYKAPQPLGTVMVEDAASGEAQVHSDASPDPADGPAVGRESWTQMTPDETVKEFIRFYNVIISWQYVSPFLYHC